MSQRMGGCAAAWQAVRGVPESREHVVTGTGGGGGAVKSLAPHLTVALEELARLSDAMGKEMQRAEGATERKHSSHSSSVSGCLSATHSRK